jgi:ubiquinone/menaquinone biosynthesis C-methylase UbiE
MSLARLQRFITRPLRRAIRLRPSRPLRPLPLTQEHVDSDARLFWSRQAYLDTLPKGGVWTEVGVLRGDFASQILTKTKPTKLHLIDKQLTRFDVRTRFADRPNVECHEGQSTDVLATFPDAYFDCVYIDAGHRYANVRADATVAARKTKPAGIIIFNDYVIWSHIEGYEYGIVATVNEMCVNEGWQIVAFCLQQEMYCDVALRRRP